MHQNPRNAPLTLALIALSMATTLHAATFEEVGANAFVAGCSDDGSVVVGSANGQAFRWTTGGGFQSIGGFEASDVSADGNVIVGTILDGGIQRAAHWNETDTWTSLGDMPGGASCDAFLSSSWGTNEDGSVIVGLGWVAACRAHGFRWDSGTGMVDLGSTVTDRSSRANDVSDDGSVILGWQDGSTGFRQGARWIDGVQTLFYSLGDLEVGEAQAATPDGSIIVGGSTQTSEAWRWTGGAYVEPIGNLPGFNFRSTAAAVSDDGSVVVGFAGFGGDRDAFIWIEGQGMQKLDDYLVSIGIMDAVGWDLATATGISADGTVIVGWGFDPGFALKGWRVDISGPIGVSETVAPASIRIDAARPNPFRASTEIAYSLENAASTRVEIHDVAGRTVRTLTDAPASAGAHRIIWDARGDEGLLAAPGVYFVRVSAAGHRAMQRIVLLD